MEGSLPSSLRHLQQKAEALDCGEVKAGLLPSGYCTGEGVATCNAVSPGELNARYMELLVVQASASAL